MKVHRKLNTFEFYNFSVRLKDGKILDVESYCEKNTNFRFWTFFFDDIHKVQNISYPCIPYDDFTSDSAFEK